MSNWRQLYKVHPAADVFPMMSDEELAKLGEDILAKGLITPILFWDGGAGPLLIDGRNRLEAMERVGREANPSGLRQVSDKDPVPLLISLNIHRRHLTKQQQADLIVAAIKAGAEASRQLGEVPKRHVKGKAGSEKDATKAAAVATAKDHGIGKRTVERAIAKAEGKLPAPRESKAARVKREFYEHNPDYPTYVESPPRTLEDHAEIINEAWAEHLKYLKEMVGHLTEARATFGADGDETFVNWLVKDAGLSLRISLVVASHLAEGLAASGDLVEALSDAMVSEMLDAAKSKPEPKKRPCKKCHGAGTITSKKTGTTVDCDCARA